MRSLPGRIVRAADTVPGFSGCGVDRADGDCEGAAPIGTEAHRSRARLTCPLTMNNLSGCDVAPPLSRSRRYHCSVSRSRRAVLPTTWGPEIMTGVRWRACCSRRAGAAPMARAPSASGRRRAWRQQLPPAIGVWPPRRVPAQRNTAAEYRGKRAMGNTAPTSWPSSAATAGWDCSSVQGALVSLSAGRRVPPARPRRR